MITLQEMKKNLEEEKKKVEEEKRQMEERIRSLEREMNEMKHPKEETFPIIKSLSHFTLNFSDRSNLTVQGNTITHIGSYNHETCVFKDILEPVCILTTYRLLFLF